VIVYLTGPDQQAACARQAPDTTRNPQDMFHRIPEQNQAHHCMRFIVVAQMVVDNFQGAGFARSNIERPDFARRDDNCEKEV
jgi:uncharacterized protein (DUF2384 family)